MLRPPDFWKLPNGSGTLSHLHKLGAKVGEMCISGALVYGDMRAIINVGGADRVIGRPLVRTIGNPGGKGIPQDARGTQLHAVSSKTLSVFIESCCFNYGSRGLASY